MPPAMGLVCFRLKASNLVNEKLNKKINESGKIHLTPAKVGDIYILRFAVCSRLTEEEDISLAWREVQDQVDSITNK